MGGHTAGLACHKPEKTWQRSVQLLQQQLSAPTCPSAMSTVTKFPYSSTTRKEKINLMARLISSQDTSTSISCRFRRGDGTGTRLTFVSWLYTPWQQRAHRR